MSRRPYSPLQRLRHPVPAFDPVDDLEMESPELSLSQIGGGGRRYEPSEPARPLDWEAFGGGKLPEYRPAPPDPEDAAMDAELFGGWNEPRPSGLRGLREPSAPPASPVGTRPAPAPAPAPEPHPADEEFAPAGQPPPNPALPVWKDANGQPQGTTGTGQAESALGSFGRGLERNIGSAVGGTIGGIAGSVGAGLALAAIVSNPVGWVAGLVGLAGGLAGALGGMKLGQAMQDALLGEEETRRRNEQYAIDQAQHPYATFAGAALPHLAGGAAESAVVKGIGTLRAANAASRSRLLRAGAKPNAAALEAMQGLAKAQQDVRLAESAVRSAKTPLARETATAQLKTARAALKGLVDTARENGAVAMTPAGQAAFRKTVNSTYLTLEAGATLGWPGDAPYNFNAPEYITPAQELGLDVQNLGERLLSEEEVAKVAEARGSKVFWNSVWQNLSEGGGAIGYLPVFGSLHNARYQHDLERRKARLVEPWNPQTGYGPGYETNPEYLADLRRVTADENLRAIEAKREHTIRGLAADIAMQSLPFMLEIGVAPDFIAARAERGAAARAAASLGNMLAKAPFNVTGTLNRQEQLKANTWSITPGEWDALNVAVVRRGDDELTALWKAWADNGIEYLSEGMGEVAQTGLYRLLLKKKAPGKVVRFLREMVDEAPPAGSMRSMLKAGGSQPLFEQYEERAGDIMRILAGIDDHAGDVHEDGTPVGKGERILQAFNPFDSENLRQWGAEFIAFSVPGAAQGVSALRSQRRAEATGAAGLDEVRRRTADHFVRLGMPEKARAAAAADTPEAIRAGYAEAVTATFVKTMRDRAGAELDDAMRQQLDDTLKAAPDIPSVQAEILARFLSSETEMERALAASSALLAGAGEYGEASDGEKEALAQRAVNVLSGMVQEWGNVEGETAMDRLDAIVADANLRIQNGTLDPSAAAWKKADLENLQRMINDRAVHAATSITVRALVDSLSDEDRAQFDRIAFSNQKMEFLDRVLRSKYASLNANFAVARYVVDNGLLDTLPENMADALLGAMGRDFAGFGYAVDEKASPRERLRQLTEAVREDERNKEFLDLFARTGGEAQRIDVATEAAEADVPAAFEGAEEPEAPEAPVAPAAAPEDDLDMSPPPAPPAAPAETAAPAPEAAPAPQSVQQASRVVAENATTTPESAPAPEPPPAPRGPIALHGNSSKTGEVYLGKGDAGTGTQRIGVSYRVVEAADIAATRSRGEVQERDESVNPALAGQVAQIADRLDFAQVAESPDATMGAPILTKAGIALAGNGRALGIQRAYAEGKAEDYRARLVQWAKENGLGDVSDLQQPVLVRIVVDNGGLTDAQIALLSNRATGAAINNAESAMAFAGAILRDDSLFGGSAAHYSGMTLAELLRDERFVRRLQTVTGYQGEAFTPQGRVTPEFEDNVRRAMVIAALTENSDGKDRAGLIRRLSNDQSEGIKAAVDAIAETAPSLLAMRKNGAYRDVSILREVGDALAILASIRADGLTVGMWTGQGSLAVGAGNTVDYRNVEPVTRALVEWFGGPDHGDGKAHPSSKEKNAALLKSYIRHVGNRHDALLPGMGADIATGATAKWDILKQALRDMDSEAKEGPRAKFGQSIIGHNDGSANQGTLFSRGRDAGHAPTVAERAIIARVKRLVAAIGVEDVVFDEGAAAGEHGSIDARKDERGEYTGRSVIHLANLRAGTLFHEVSHALWYHVLAQEKKHPRMAKLMRQLRSIANSAPDSVYDSVLANYADQGVRDPEILLSELFAHYIEEDAGRAFLSAVRESERPWIVRVWHKIGEILESAAGFWLPGMKSRYRDVRTGLRHVAADLAAGRPVDIEGLLSAAERGASEPADITDDAAAMVAAPGSDPAARMPVGQVRRELVRRGLPPTGAPSILRDRLRDALREEEAARRAAEAEEVRKRQEQQEREERERAEREAREREAAEAAAAARAAEEARKKAERDARKAEKEAERQRRQQEDAEAARQAEEARQADETARANRTPEQQKEAREAEIARTQEAFDAYKQRRLADKEDDDDTTALLNASKNLFDYLSGLEKARDGKLAAAEREEAKPPPKPKTVERDGQTIDLQEVNRLKREKKIRDLRRQALDLTRHIDDVRAEFGNPDFPTGDLDQAQEAPAQQKPAPAAEQPVAAAPAPQPATEQPAAPEALTENAETPQKTDRQGNPLNEDGTLRIEPVASVADLTDEDFTAPTRNVQLPQIPANVDAAIGANGKPVVIKRNIFARNAKKHSDLKAEESRDILNAALYSPDLYGQNKKAERPYNWVVINTKDSQGDNRLVVLEVNDTKDNIEVVHWHFIDQRGLEKIKKQAEREDGQLLILPSVSEEAGALSGPALGFTQNVPQNAEQSSGTAEEQPAASPAPQQQEQPPAEQPAEQPEQPAQPAASDNRGKLVDEIKRIYLKALSSEGDKAPIKNIRELRHRAAKWGIPARPGGQDDAELQELFELGLVQAAREALQVRRGKRQDLYKVIVRLYNMQMTAGRRDSEREEKQQFSTPLPMGFVADWFVYGDRESGSVRSILEPTAGNGMLLIGVPPGIVHANEISKRRLENLRAQGFKRVTEQDALDAWGETYDGIVANPPFGESPRSMVRGGKAITGIDRQMAATMLDSMADDGRAAIIIGGNLKYRPNGALAGPNAAFFGWLYDHYNVRGILNMSGDLYRKQGTTFPTMMILVDGRRSEEDRRNVQVFPPVREKAAGFVDNFDDLYNKVNALLHSEKKHDGYEKVLQSPRETPVPVADQPSGTADGGRHPGQSPQGDRQLAGERGELGLAPAGQLVHGGDVGSPAGGTSEAVYGETGDRGGNRAPDGGRDADGAWGVRGAGPDAEGSGGSRGGTGGSLSGGTRGTGGGGNRADVVSGGGSASQPDRVGLTARPNAPKGRKNLTAENEPYRRHSSGKSLESITPAYMADAMDRALTRIEKTSGQPVDEHVRHALGYETTEDLHKALAAEQVDSVALAIDRMRDGHSCIIGDQTGVGKGRQMAALIRFARNEGRKPIFLTCKATLFSDIYRDLSDIGSGNLRPLILNADSDAIIRDAEGNVVYRQPKNIKEILKSGVIPDEYDYVVATYSQVQNASIGKDSDGLLSFSGNGAAKARFLFSNAGGNYVFMDESHNASGESNTGFIAQALVQTAKGAVFASATPTKRANTMPLYLMRSKVRNAIGAAPEAGDSAKKLIRILEQGGNTVMEVFSRALTESGEMVRRERDMTGVENVWETVSDAAQSVKVRKQYDNVIGLFNAICDFQQKYVGDALQEINDTIRETGGWADNTKGTKEFGVNNTPLFSQTYNYVRQLLLALKTDAIVEHAAAEIQAGRKPVLALENTMEAALSEYPEGSVVQNDTFGAILKRGLRSCMKYTETINGNKVERVMDPSELSPEGQEEYRRLSALCDSLVSDVYISPVDAIAEGLRARGYSVGELSGRTSYLEHDDRGRSIVRRRSAADRDQGRLARDFNAGKLDALIVGKTGSTGISLHASEKFADQRQRTMIIAQPMADVSQYQQMAGRIDRTGQVHRGRYIHLSLPVSAEQRFNMMLARKLKTLNAATTTSQERESDRIEVPDIINKYGARCAIEALADRPDIYRRLRDPFKLDADTDAGIAAGLAGIKRIDEDTASAILARIAWLPTRMQEEFYEDVGNRYAELISYLDEIGENDLKITVLPLAAKTIRAATFAPGDNPNSPNPLDQDANVEEIDAAVVRKPMKAAEIRALMEKMGGKDKGSPAILRERMEEYVREKRKAGATDEDAIRKIRASVQSAINSFKVGRAYMVPSLDAASDTGKTFNASEADTALFVGFKVGKKYSRSTTRLVFATLSGTRRFEVPLSKKDLVQAISTTSAIHRHRLYGVNLDSWDGLGKKEARERLYVLTGNLLRALSQSYDEKTQRFTGRIITYTDAAGEVHDGILMPRKWQPKQLLENVTRPISSAYDDIRANVPVASSDGEILITNNRFGGITLHVPKARKTGEKYFLDTALRALSDSGNFYERGKYKVADIPKSKLRQLLDRLDQLGVRVRDSSAQLDWNDAAQDASPASTTLHSRSGAGGPARDWSSAKIPEIRRELVRRGLSPSGSAAALRRRLEEADRKRAGDEEVLYSRSGAGDQEAKDLATARAILGDKEIVGNGKLLKMPPALQRQEALRIYRKLKDGDSIPTMDGRDIKFAISGFKELRQHSADPHTLALVGVLPQVIRTMHYFGEGDLKPGDAEKGITAYHLYARRVNLGDGPMVARIVIREHKNGDFFYDGDATELEKIPGPTYRNPNPGSTRDFQFPAHSISEFFARVKWPKAEENLSTTLHSRSGLYTGSAADYANRRPDGAIENGPSLQHIGTGEGSQVYGWGLYASNRRGVAESYAKNDAKFKSYPRVFVDGEEVASNPYSVEISVRDEIYEALRGEDFDKAKGEARLDRIIEQEEGLLRDPWFGQGTYAAERRKRVQNLREALNLMRSGRVQIQKNQASPYLYEQTFFTNRATPEETERHLLKWYEPVSDEQLEWIDAQLAKEKIAYFWFRDFFHKPTGEKVYEGIQKLFRGKGYRETPKLASEFLARAGIDGVKYPVNSYGGKSIKDGDTAGWNYVSFRDDNIRVDHKWRDGEVLYSRSGVSSSDVDRWFDAKVVERRRGSRRFYDIKSGDDLIGQGYRSAAAAEFVIERERALLDRAKDALAVSGLGAERLANISEARRLFVERMKDSARSNEQRAEDFEQFARSIGLHKDLLEAEWKHAKAILTADSPAQADMRAAVANRAATTVLARASIRAIHRDMQKFFKERLDKDLPAGGLRRNILVGVADARAAMDRKTSPADIQRRITAAEARRDALAEMLDSNEDASGNELSREEREKVNREYAEKVMELRILRAFEGLKHNHPGKTAAALLDDLDAWNNAHSELERIARQSIDDIARIEAERSEQAAADRAIILDEMTGGVPIPPSSEQHTLNAQHPVRRQLFDTMRGWFAGILGGGSAWGEFLTRKKGVGYMQGHAAKLLHEGAAAGQAVEDTMNEEDGRNFIALLNRFTKKNLDPEHSIKDMSDWYAYCSELYLERKENDIRFRKVSFGSEKNPDTGKEQRVAVITPGEHCHFSIDELMHIYLIGLQAQEAAGQPYTDLPKKRKGVDTSLMESMLKGGYSAQTMREISAVLARGGYDEMAIAISEDMERKAPLLDQLMERIFHSRLKRVKYYCPLRRTHYGLLEKGNQSANGTGQFMSLVRSFLKERVSNHRDIKPTHLISVWQSHNRQANHIIANADWISRMARIFRSQEIQGALDWVLGTKARQMFNSWLDIQVRGGSLQFDNGVADEIGRTFARVQTQTPRVSIKQTTSPTAAIPYLPEWASLTRWHADLAKIIINRNLRRRFITMLAEESPSWRLRGTFASDIQAMAARENAARTKPGRIYRLVGTKLNRKLGAMTSWGDKLGAVLGCYGIYRAWERKLIKDGKSAEEAKRVALDKFVEAMNGSQQSAVPEYVSHYQTLGNAYRFLSMFMSAQIAMTRNYILKAKACKEGRISKLEFAKTVYGITMAQFLFRQASKLFRPGLMTLAGVAAWMLGHGPDPDDDDDEHPAWETLKDGAHALLATPFSGLFIIGPVLGEVVEYLIDRSGHKMGLEKRKPRAPQIASALLPAAESLEDLVPLVLDAPEQIMGLDKMSPDERERFLRKAADAISLATGNSLPKVLAETGAGAYDAWTADDLDLLQRAARGLSFSRSAIGAPKRKPAPPNAP